MFKDGTRANHNSRTPGLGKTRQSAGKYDFKHDKGIPVSEKSPDRPDRFSSNSPSLFIEYAQIAVFQRVEAVFLAVGPIRAELPADFVVLFIHGLLVGRTFVAQLVGIAHFLRLLGADLLGHAT
jgi:hypothetical protein